MLASELIKAHHLQRLAIVYVRQSSPHQVLTNTESQRLQLALRQRAEELGWARESIRVLASDTAQSAKTLVGRADFQELVTLVSTDQVGILFAYDAQRLARNCTDWYPLLDVRGFRQCRAPSMEARSADGDGIYDPADPNGRLLLGLKGQIAEWELHILQRRCLDALEAKAQRGELNQILPAGLERDAADVVRKAANQEIQDRLTLVFDAFESHKSISKTVRHLRQRGLSVPRKDRFGQIVWRSPTVSSIGSILTNPAYAGAYVRGRTQPYRNAQGKMRQRRLPMDQWRICLRDKYPPYVSWERFKAIYAMIQDNYLEYDRNRTRGVPRPGKALLHGLMCCGECGHKMVVQYKGGTRYLCNFLRGQHQTPICQHLPGDAIDAWVVQQFFAALSTAGPTSLVPGSVCVESGASPPGANASRSSLGAAVAAAALSGAIGRATVPWRRSRQSLGDRRAGAALGRSPADAARGGGGLAARASAAGRGDDADGRTPGAAGVSGPAAAGALGT